MVIIFAVRQDEARQYGQDSRGEVINSSCGFKDGRFGDHLFCCISRIIRIELGNVGHLVCKNESKNTDNGCRTSARVGMSE